MKKIFGIMLLLIVAVTVVTTNVALAATDTTKPVIKVDIADKSTVELLTTVNITINDPESKIVSATYDLSGIYQNIPYAPANKWLIPLTNFNLPGKTYKLVVTATNEAGLTKKQTVDAIKEKIKGQDEQVFNVVNNFFDFVLNKRILSDFEYKETKDNILLIGGTGVGKTAIIETLSRIFSIPYKRVDATNYSGTGLVGNDVNSIFKELVDSCGGDPKMAENAIVFIDEIDKIASNFDRVDIGKGVQDALLTLVEGSIRTINPGYQENFKPYNIDTSKTLFIGGGAFEGIDEIKKARIKKEKTGSSLGFKQEKEAKVINEEITTDDIAKYGIDRQLVGRFPNIIKLNLLGEETLYNIVNSEQGYVNLKVKSYELSGVKIEMSEGFKRSLAKIAYQDKKGARSIRTVFKRVLNEIDRNNLDDSVEEVILDDNSLEDFKTIQYVKKR